MKKLDKEETMKKWAPVLDSMGLTGSKTDWMSTYCEKVSGDLDNFNGLTKSDDSFPSILPIARRVAAQTIGLDLVNVSPLGGGNLPGELEEIRNEVKIENRDRKIESLTEDKEFDEMKVEDHPKYKKTILPSGKLLYIDFKYGDPELDQDKNGPVKGRRPRKKKS